MHGLEVSFTKNYIWGSYDLEEDYGRSRSLIDNFGQFKGSSRVEMNMVLLRILRESQWQDAIDNGNMDCTFSYVTRGRTQKVISAEL